MVRALSERHTSRPYFPATESSGIDDDDIDADNDDDNDGDDEPFS